MHWVHAEHPERRVRLAYCLNLHAADSVDDTLRGIREVTLPLRDRIAPASAFGVGLYLPNEIARVLDADPAAAESFGSFLADEGLDPFTFNAFPFGGFHADSLKEHVFRPTWADASRLEFTSCVARLAAAFAQRTGGLGDPAHVSISTHAGRFGPWPPDGNELGMSSLALARFAWEAARIEAKSGVRIVLSIEPEPRSSANDLAELERFLAHVREVAPIYAPRAALCSTERMQELLERHVGICLDACHAAVEFEDGAGALGATAVERPLGPLGKLQFSSALALRDPLANDDGRERLLAMAEPRYLHQVTGRTRTGELVRATDLPELLAMWREASWSGCDEWRCHFHVPVDLDEVGDPGLGTTRADADALLTRVLAAPATWGTPELHLEIETYTWDVLPGAARGSGALVDGLEREYRHVMGLLEAAGWRRA